MRIGRVLDASDSRHNPARTRTRGYRLESPEKSLLRRVNDDEGSLTSVDRVTLRAMGEVPWDERPGFDGVSYAERHDVSHEELYDEGTMPASFGGNDDTAERRAQILDRMRRQHDNTRPTPAPEPANEKQEFLITRLLGQLVLEKPDVFAIADEWIKVERDAGKLTKVRASEVIDRLKVQLGYDKNWKREARPVSAPPAIDYSTPIDYFEDIPDGYYALREEGDHIKFFRVSTWKHPYKQEPRPGRKVQSVVGGDKLYPMNRAGGRTILREIREAGVRETAKLYADEIGRCCRCNLSLTDEESRARGMGPTCASKGW